MMMPFEQIMFDLRFLLFTTSSSHNTNQPIVQYYYTQGSLTVFLPELAHVHRVRCAIARSLVNGIVFKGILLNNFGSISCDVYWKLRVKVRTIDDIH